MGSQFLHLQNRQNRSTRVPAGEGQGSWVVSLSVCQPRFPLIFMLPSLISEASAWGLGHLLGLSPGERPPVPRGPGRLIRIENRPFPGKQESRGPCPDKPEACRGNGAQGQPVQGQLRRGPSGPPLGLLGAPLFPSLQHLKHWLQGCFHLS